MHIASIVERAVALEYLNEVFSCLCFGKSAFLPQQLSQIAARTVLGDNVAVVSCEERVYVSQHVAMPHFPETVDFSLQHESRGVIS